MYKTLQLYASSIKNPSYRMAFKSVATDKAGLYDYTFCPNEESSIVFFVLFFTKCQCCLQHG